MTVYLANAFSLNMLDTEGMAVGIEVWETKPAKVLDMLSDADNVESYVGHESTARLMSHALGGFPIPVHRANLKLGLGDTLVICQPRQRLPEGKVLTNEELASIPTTWYCVHVLSERRWSQ